MILRRFRTRSENRNIRDLYGAIVAQARRPTFYRSYGVPDTVAGRFDLIVLHLVLLLERLGRDGAGGAGIGQELFDVFCSDLDANLREMGVGDLAVPKRMREYGEAFYGRQAAYRAAFAAADARALENALQRNIFAGMDDDRGAVRLARYVRIALRQFEGQRDNALLRGEVVFPEPEIVTEAVNG
jgi:cytochrome b pre-mRNA-processing protein 3